MTVSPAASESPPKAAFVKRLSLSVPRIRKSSEFGERFPFTPGQRFAFRWMVLFFRGELLSTITMLVPAAYSTKLYTSFTAVGPRNYPDWFKSFWPECPGCSYNPMFWQAEFPWSAITALVGAVIWRLLDRDKLDYRRAHALWRVAMRYSLGMSMIGWGLFKIVGSQFWGLHADAFLIARPLGEWAARALMWNTMGQSVTYGMFTGFGEIVGGVLLLFRSTTLLGALILAPLNFTVFLLDALMNRGGVTAPALWGALVSVALIVPDWKRLRAFFVRNDSVAPSGDRRIIPGTTGLVVKLLVLLLLAKGTVASRAAPIFSSKEWAEAGWHNVPHHMTGVFKVESMTRNGTPIVPRHDDTTQWAFIGFGGRRAQSTNMRGGWEAPDGMFIVRPDGAIHEGYAFTLDSVNRTMTVDTTVQARPLQGMQFATWHGTVTQPFTYERLDIDRMVIHAIISGDTIVARLNRFQPHETTLFGSLRLFPHNYGTPIRWPGTDSIRLTR